MRAQINAAAQCRQLSLRPAGGNFTILRWSALQRVFRRVTRTAAGSRLRSTDQDRAQIACKSRDTVVAEAQIGNSTGEASSARIEPNWRVKALRGNPIFEQLRGIALQALRAAHVSRTECTILACVFMCGHGWLARHRSTGRA